jgi:hypothetical protein
MTYMVNKEGKSTWLSRAHEVRLRNKVNGPVKAINLNCRETNHTLQRRVLHRYAHVQLYHCHYTNINLFKVDVCMCAVRSNSLISRE